METLHGTTGLLADELLPCFSARNAQALSLRNLGWKSILVSWTEADLSGDPERRSIELIFQPSTILSYHALNKEQRERLHDGLRKFLDRILDVHSLGIPLAQEVCQFPENLHCGINSAAQLCAMQASNSEQFRAPPCH